MASWILVPCLASLRGEFNLLAPDRDRASDGSIGDPAHASSSSDHNPDETGNTPYEDSDSTNEVHAIDTDADLRKSGWTMGRATEIIRVRHRDGKDDRLQNIIYNKRITSRSWGWSEWRAYTGSNDHSQHAHFSARYTTTQEADTRPWGLLEAEEDEMPTAEEVADAVIAKLREQAGKDAVYNGVNQDRIQSYDTDFNSLVQTARKATADDNGFMTWASALTYAVKNSYFTKALGLKTDDKVDALLTLAKAQAATLTGLVESEELDDQEAEVQRQQLLTKLQEAMTAVDQVPGRSAEATLAALAATAGDEEAADLIRSIYGEERAAAIGDLLLAKPPSA